MERSKRQEVIETNCIRLLGSEDGALRDVDTGRFADKPLRLIPKDD